MKRSIFAIFAVLCLMASATSAFAAPTFTAPAGYEATEYLSMSTETLIEAFDVDTSGNVYYIESKYQCFGAWYMPDVSSLKKYDASASTTDTLYDFSSGVWGSFVRLDGDEVVFGESSYGEIRSYSISGAATSDVYTLAGQYDLKYNSLGQMFVSANTGSGNAVYHIYDDGLVGIACDKIVDVGGYSGPIEFDENDDLYYGFGSGEVVRIDATDIASAIAAGDLTNAELDSTDWSSYCIGLSACSFLQFAFDGDLISSSWAGVLEAITSQDTFESFGFSPDGNGLGHMAFVDDDNGGTLYVMATDYSMGEYTNTIYAITPTAAIPEPSTIVMILGGLVAGGGCVVRRMKK